MRFCPRSLTIITFSRRFLLAEEHNKPPLFSKRAGEGTYYNLCRESISARDTHMLYTVIIAVMFGSARLAFVFQALGKQDTGLALAFRFDICWELLLSGNGTT
jgi:hypothetical protein